MTADKGTIELEDNQLKVSFRYSKYRFEAIRRLDGARYDKENKCWMLPIKHLPGLEKSRYFRASEVSYLFDIDSVRQCALQEQEAKAVARNQIKQDPFTVPKLILDQAEVDLKIFLHQTQPILLAKAKGRAKRLVEAHPEIHFLYDEKLHHVPTFQLRGLLQGAMKGRISFGVEAEASSRLKLSAPIRQRLQAGFLASKAELELALLTPIVTVKESAARENEKYFSLENATAQQLKSLFASTRFNSERLKLASSLDLDQLLELLKRSLNTDVYLWLTKEASESLKNVQSAYLKEYTARVFPAHLLTLIKPNIFWHLDCFAKAGLFVHTQELQGSISPELQTLLSQTKRLVPHQAPTHFLFTESNPKILPFYRAVSAATKSSKELPQTDDFARLLSELERRESLLKRQALLHSLADCDPQCQDQSLQSRLFPHQRIAVQWLLNTDVAFLGDDMGLGKTLSVLVSFAELKRRNLVDRLLVVCPNSLVSNWIREAAAWLSQLNLVSLPRSKARREEFLANVATDSNLFVDGLVVNYEALRLPYVYPPIAEACKLKRTLLVLDESQRAKNSQSKTFEALKELSHASARRVLLSGTPTPKELADIWSQMYLLDHGERYGDNYFEWLAKVAEIGNKWSDYAVNSYKQEESTEAVSRLHELLLRRKKEDVLSLPEKTFSTRDIFLEGDQYKRYNEIRKELLLTITSQTGESFVRHIDNILEEYLRAVQIASNPRLIDPNWVGTPAKFSELDEIVQEVVEENDRSLVIWTNYLVNVRELVERYQNLKTAPFSGEVKPETRAQTIADFQSGAIKILVAVPAAGGVGITLTAAQTAVYIDKTWNGEHWMQSIDRLHRIGQKGTVQIISLHACKVDQLISANLERKRQAQTQLMAHSITASTAPTRDELLQALKADPSQLA